MGVFDGIADVGKVNDDVAAGPSGSPILDAGQLVITGMWRTTGSGAPEQGESFELGAARLLAAGETVGSASPGGDWQGAGAEAYTAANLRQAERATSLAVLDRNVHTVIAREAYQVGYHRDKLEDQSNYLVDLSQANWSIAATPGVGRAMQAAFELAAVKAALSNCSTELDQLSQEVGDNAEQLQVLAGQYSTLTQTISDPPDLDDGPSPPASDDPAESNPTDQHQPDPTAQGPAELPAAGAPTQVVGPGAPAGVTAGVAGLTEPAAASSPPADAMTGMTSAFGAVGGMIGSIVAPMAAALAGVAGAAGQSLSMLTSAGGADLGTETVRSMSDGEADGPPDDNQEPEPADADADAAEGAVPPAVATESQGPQPLPADTLEPDQPAAPPAATRPPQ